MYPVIKSSGAYSPGSAGTSSTVTNATARTSSYTQTIPATAKERDILLVFTSCDSGQASVNCPQPSMAGHSFTFETYCGGDSTSGLHGGWWFTELTSDGTKTLQLTLPNGSSNTADSSVMWLLIDGASVARDSSGVFDPGWTRSTAQSTASTSHPIFSQAAGDATAPSGNYLAIAMFVNDASTSSVTYAYTAPSGWTKALEVGSREYVDSTLMTRTFDGQTGYASVNATYGASAVYTRMSVFIPGAPDFNVEYVGATQGEIASGGSMWVDKPAGAAADDEPSTFNFRAQSTTKNRVTIERFKNVHPTRPIAHGYTQAGNTTTTSTSHVSAALTAMSRAMMVQLFTVSSALGKWTAYSPSGATGIPQQPAGGGNQDTWPIYDNTATAAQAKTATYSVAATWNAASFMLRPADTLASGVEVLVAWHTMDASQNGSLQTTPDWGGWTLLGSTTRVSTAGAYNIKCYYKVVKTPQSVVWKAAVDAVIADTVGTSVGYEGTQYQAGTDSNPQNDSTGLPVQQAPGGRPGMATKIVIPDAYTRREQNPSHRQFITGDKYWFSFSFYLDDDFPLDANSWQVVEQLHGAPGGGSPVVAFEVKNGQLRLTGGANKPKVDSGSWGSTYAYDILALDNIQKYRWYTVEYYVEFSDVAANSRVDAWVNDTQVITNYQPPCATHYSPATVLGGGPTYRKQGFYHDKALPGGTIWHGGSALGRTRAAVSAGRTLVTRTEDHVSDFSTDPSFLTYRTSSTQTFNNGFWILANASAAGTATTSAGGSKTRVNGDLAFTSTYCETVRLPIAPPDGTPTLSSFNVYSNTAASNEYVCTVYDSKAATISFQYRVGGVDSAAVTLPFSAAHRWWRIRNTGAYVIWETSADGTVGSWVERRRISAPSWANAKDHGYSFETYTTYRADTNADWFTIDNLNVVGVPLGKAGFGNSGILGLDSRGIQSGVVKGGAGQIALPLVIRGLGTKYVPGAGRATLPLTTSAAGSKQASGRCNFGVYLLTGPDGVEYTNPFRGARATGMQVRPGFGRAYGLAWPNPTGLGAPQRTGIGRAPALPWGNPRGLWGGSTRTGIGRVTLQLSNPTSGGGGGRIVSGFGRALAPAWDVRATGRKQLIGFNRRADALLALGARATPFMGNQALLADAPLFYGRGEPNELDLVGGKTIWVAGTEAYTDGAKSGSAYAVSTAGYRGVQVYGGWLATSQMSVEAWVRVPNPATGGYQEIFNARTSPANEGWILYLTPDGRMKFSAGTGAGTNGEAGPTVPASYVPANTWIHAVGTCDGTTRNLYVNGVLAGSSGGGAYVPPVPSQQLRFGNLNAAAGSSAMDDVAVYDYPLSPAQVAAHYAHVPGGVRRGGYGLAPNSGFQASPAATGRGTLSTRLGRGTAYGLNNVGRSYGPKAIFGRGRVPARFSVLSFTARSIAGVRGLLGFGAARGLFPKNPTAQRPEVITPYVPRDRPQVIRPFTAEDCRILAQHARSRAWLHGFVPLSGAKIKFKLSGGTEITGTIQPEIQSMKDKYGQPVLKDYSTLLHFEINGDLWGTGLLQPLSSSGSALNVTASGLSTYPEDIPYMGEYSKVNIDAYDVLIEGWRHVQSFPNSNLRVGVKRYVDRLPNRLGLEPKDAASAEEEYNDDGTPIVPDMTIEKYKYDPKDQKIWDFLLSPYPGTISKPGMGYPWFVDTDKIGTVNAPKAVTERAKDLIRTDKATGRVYQARVNRTDVSQNVWDSLISQGYGGYESNSMVVPDNILVATNKGLFKPWEMVSWDAPMVGAKINETLKSGQLDYLETTAYTDKDKTDTKQDIRALYPRVGWRREEPRFVQGENIGNVVDPTQVADFYASAVFGIGAGEGRQSLRRVIESIYDPDRVRKVHMYRNARIKDAAEMDAIIRASLAARQETLEISSIEVKLFSRNAKLGDYWLGDDILVQAETMWFGWVKIWHRILEIEIDPERQVAVLTLRRSDSFSYGRYAESE